MSVSSSSEQANGESRNPSISADGRFVTFASRATNLLDGDTNDSYDIFVHDRQTGQTTRVDVEEDGEQGNSDSTFPSISANGKYIAFESYASNLVDDDTNGFRDIFVAELRISPTATP